LITFTMMEKKYVKLAIIHAKYIKLFI